MAKIIQEQTLLLLLLVALATVISTEACTSCTRNCSSGRECRILEYCFHRCSTSQPCITTCTLFQACLSARWAPRSDACPGRDPVLDFQRNVLVCSLAEGSTDRPCPGDTICTPTRPDSVNGVCCPCSSGPAAMTTTTTTTTTTTAETPDLLSAQGAPSLSLLSSFQGLQAAEAPTPAPTDVTQETTTRLMCPFFPSACGRRRRR